MKKRVLLSIDSKVLQQLLENHELQVGDFSCSDPAAKQALQQIYLRLTQRQLLNSPRL